MGKWGKGRLEGHPPEEGSDPKREKKRLRWTVGRIIALSLAGAAVLTLAFAGLHYYNLMRNPGSAFQTQPAAPSTPGGDGDAYR